MGEFGKDLRKGNLKIDNEVVAKAEKLRDSMPVSQRPREGADYKLTPPLGGKSIDSNTPMNHRSLITPINGRRR